MDTLEDAIRKIDLETRDLLQQTFDQVNEHFGRMFPTLFGGGNARLVMTGDEILDAGVQVMAQPPGKKNSTIHLLSGGEKALTAIALVFAIFQLNPAPFCLLDEVDAPLDDANTERYCKLVTEMSERHAVPLHHAQQDRDGDGRAADRRDDAGAGRVAHRRGRHGRGGQPGRGGLSAARPLRWRCARRSLGGCSVPGGGVRARRHGTDALGQRAAWRGAVRPAPGTRGAPTAAGEPTLPIDARADAGQPAAVRAVTLLEPAPEPPRRGAARASTR